MLSFYRIPKLLFTNAYFKELDVSAKVLYGLMLDRMSLSLKNKWFDEQQRAFIYFAQQEASEMLGFGDDKIRVLFNKLEEFGFQTTENPTLAMTWQAASYRTMLTYLRNTHILKV
jgi:hypothetical protein